MNPDLENLASHDAWLRALARRLVGNEHAAEDAVQETFAAAIERPPSHSLSLRGWLGTVLRNGVFLRRRAEGRRLARERRASRPEGVPAADELVESEATRRRVVDALFALEEPWRETLLLRYYRALPPRTIAKETGVPVATVHTRLRRGLELLRERLDRKSGGARAAWVIGLVKLFPEVAIVSTGAKLGLAAAAAVLLATLGGIAFLRNRGDDAPRSGTEGFAVAGAPTAAASTARAESSGAAPARSAAEAIPKNPPPASETGSFTLQVLWGDDQRPAPGVGAEVVPWGAAEPIFQRFDAMSDAAGRIHEEGISPGKLGIYGDRGGNSTLEIRAGEETEGTLTIPPGVLAEGFVVNPEGAAVPDATVWVFPFGNHSRGFASARSGPDGRFSVRNVKPGHDLAALAPGYLGSKIVSLGRDPHGSVQLRLELGRPAGSLELRVLRPDGTPAAGARVLLGPEHPHSPPRQMLPGPADIVADRPSIHGVTDAAGRFATTSAPIGTLPLVVRGRGLPPWSGEATIDPNETSKLEIRLEASASLEGTVRESSGAPVAGAWVVVSRDGSDSTYDLGDIAAQTGPDGRYRIVGIPTGTSIALVKNGDGARLAQHRLSAEPQQTLRWDAVIDASPGIRGRVVDPTGRGLARWRVYPQRTSFDWTRMSENPYLTPVDANESGEFTFLSVPPGIYRLEAEAPRGVPEGGRGVLEDVVPEEEPVVIRVAALEARTAAIVGTVVNRDGTPRAATVRLFRDGRYEDQQKISGPFRFAPIGPGDCLVWLDAPGAPTIDASKRVAAGETWDLGSMVFPEAGSAVVTFRREDGKDASPGDTTTFVAAPARPAGANAHFSSDRARIEMKGGTGRIGPLAPGSYRLRQSYLAGDSAYVEVPFEIRSGEETRVEVVLRRGMKTTIPIQGTEGRPVQIRLFDGAGNLIQNSTLSTSAKGGRVSMEVRLLAGRYRIEASTERGRAGAEDFEVSEGDADAKTVPVRLK